MINYPHKKVEPNQKTDHIKTLPSLCPSCEKLNRTHTSTYQVAHTNGFTLITYCLCAKCEKKVNSITENSAKKLKLKILKRLLKNVNPYSAIIDNSQNGGSSSSVGKNISLNEHNSDGAIWNAEDSLYFKNNKGVSFLARRIHPGELESTNENNDELKKDAVDKAISFAIIHQPKSGERFYLYCGDLEGHPYHDQDFVAALFITQMTPQLKLEDLYAFYKKIQQNKQIIETFKSQK